MQNGYVIASSAGLEVVAEHLESISAEDRAQLKGKLRIGVQVNADVTLDDCEHQVNQVFCSVLPIAYGRHEDE